METKTDLIFHLAFPAEWDSAKEKGEYIPSHYADDGFIHCSTAAQLKETAARHFAEAQELRILAMKSDNLGEALKWESSRNQELFPHLYRPIQPAMDLVYEFTVKRDQLGNWQGWEV